ncbi:MAG: chemotaxis protein CheA, partial [Spirulina sp. DLM2.Bin59]
MAAQQDLSSPEPDTAFFAADHDGEDQGNFEPVEISAVEDSGKVTDPFGAEDFLALDELSLDELETFDNFLVEPEPSPIPEPSPAPAEPWEVETWETEEPAPTPTLRNPEGYQYFVTEAQDLLVTIEQELLALNETAATADIYSLMRATHTLKGAAANVGRDTIMTIAHNLEDVFRALLAPEAVIDQDVQGMLFEGYECLRLAMSAELAGEHSQDDELLNRAADIFARFQRKLGDCFDHQPPLPSSSEMGFDITKSIFEMGVQQRIEELETLITQGEDEVALAGLLQEQTEVFIGLGESLGLPGFTALSQTIQKAVMTTPEEIRAIAALALADLKTAQRQVLGEDGGVPDRSQGATLSPAWQQFTGEAVEEPPAASTVAPSPEPATAPTVDPPLPPPEPGEEIERASTPEPALISQPATPIPNSITLASDLLDDITTLTSEPEPIPTANNPVPKPISKTLRIDLDQLEHLNHLVGELLINQNQLALRDDQFQVSVQKLGDWLRKHRLTLGQLRELLPPETNGEGVSSLHRLLYSALEETSQLTQATEDMNLLVRTTASTIEREKRLSKQLRDNMESARMMPIEGLLKRFPPMVKQLSMVHQKAVNLKIQGAGVLIDKTVTENLYDALLHLVRNAFDHGIEPPEERRSRGKPEEGQIEIAAYNQGNRTIIEVRDDGQGLNVGRILERAIAHQLITATEAAQIRHSPELSERLLALLCEPGFSTAAQVTDLSGRGVGLDVVKTQLSQIKGTLNLIDRGKQGTTFSIQIRESLLSARLLICRAGQSVYGFVSNEVEQVLIPGEKLRVLAGQKVLDWHQAEDEYTIPVYELGALFKSPPRLATSRLALAGNGELQPVLTTPQNIAPVLLLRTPDGLLGLEVEQVIEEQELVIKPISDAIAPPPYLYGCSILADGRLTLVIDGAMLVQYTQRNGMRHIQEGGGAGG